MTFLYAYTKNFSFLLRIIKIYITQKSMIRKDNQPSFNSSIISLENRIQSLYFGKILMKCFLKLVFFLLSRKYLSSKLEDIKSMLRRYN